MSRRTANRARLSAAARAAVAADGWMFAARRLQDLVDLLGPRDACACGHLLAEHPRVSARLNGGTAPLVDLFTAHPKLAAWVASPEALARLIRFTGASIAGGPMSAIVDRHDVSMLISSLGEDVWRFGLDYADQPADDTAVADRVSEPEQIVARIEEEGCAAVYGFIEGLSPEVAAMAFAASDIVPSLRATHGETAGQSKRVLMVTERALP